MDARVTARDAELRVFESFDIETGLLLDLSGDAYPTQLWGFRGQPLELDDRHAGITYFGYVSEGPIELVTESGRFLLGSGMYFAVPGALSISGPEARGVVISRLDYRSLFLIGGPIEREGRLRYIDGCTDSLLIPPVLRGDACLNLLHIPAHTKQSQHTHPSERLGLILSGSGLCVTPEESIELSPQQVFRIRTGGQHSFHTADQDLRVLAYHPESDFGPTHEDHPMINKTLFEGGLRR